MGFGRRIRGEEDGETRRGSRDAVRGTVEAPMPSLRDTSASPKFTQDSACAPSSAKLTPRLRRSILRVLALRPETKLVRLDAGLKSSSHRFKFTMPFLVCGSCRPESCADSSPFAVIRSQFVN